MPMLMPGQEEEVAGSGLVMGPGAQEGKLGGEEAKLTPSAPPPGRVWRPMGGDGLGESRTSSCPLLSRGGGQPDRVCGGVQCGKGAVQFHFLHLLFTHRLDWGMMVHSGCPFGSCPGLRTV